MISYKTLEYTVDDWNYIAAEKNQQASFPLIFTVAWRDLLENSASSNCLFWMKPADYTEKLANLFTLLKPHFEKSLKIAIEAKTLFDFTFRCELSKSLKSSPETKSKICEILTKLQPYLTTTGNPSELLEFFLETFNDNLSDNLQKYTYEYVEIPEYPKYAKMQPYKLQLSLPFKTQLLYSRDAAVRIYLLLKQAVGNGTLHSAKCVRGTAFDFEILYLDKRHLKYSQFVLYLPDPLNVDLLKKLIFQINQIALEEGVYNQNYEKHCNTHISGIVSLRNDYVKGGPYKRAREFTAEDLEEQNKLPIIQQLAFPEEKEEKALAPTLQEWENNKKALQDFYLAVKSSMTKNSLTAAKGALFNQFNSIIQQDKLKKTELKNYLKLLLKILLQCNSSRLSLHTTSGDRALKLLNSSEYLLLKKIITSDDKNLVYEDLVKFAIENNDQSLKFFAVKNNHANISSFREEMIDIFVTRKLDC